MKWNVNRACFLIAALLFAGALCADDSFPKKSTGGQVYILFTDTALMRRTWGSAPPIGEGSEDYSVRIGCMGRSHCVAKIGLLFDLVSAKTKIVSSCKSPIYARITLIPESVGYGESDKNEADIYDIDYTGKCVNHSGVSYEIKKTVFWILNTLPVTKWGRQGQSD
jgi:hypothetical protein